VKTRPSIAPTRSSMESDAHGLPSRLRRRCTPVIRPQSATSLPFSSLRGARNRGWRVRRFFPRSYRADAGDIEAEEFFFALKFFAQGPFVRFGELRFRMRFHHAAEKTGLTGSFIAPSAIAGFYRSIEREEELGARSSEVVHCARLIRLSITRRLIAPISACSQN